MCTCKPHIYLPSGSPCFTVILQRPEIECQSFFALVSIEKKGSISNSRKLGDTKPFTSLFNCKKNEFFCDMA